MRDCRFARFCFPVDGVALCGFYTLFYSVPRIEADPTVVNHIDSGRNGARQSATHNGDG